MKPFNDGSCVGDFNDALCVGNLVVVMSPTRNSDTFYFTGGKVIQRLDNDGLWIAPGIHGVRPPINFGTSVLAYKLSPLNNRDAKTGDMVFVFNDLHKRGGILTSIYGYDPDTGAIQVDADVYTNPSSLLYNSDTGAIQVDADSDISPIPSGLWYKVGTYARYGCVPT